MKETKVIEYTEMVETGLIQVLRVNGKQQRKVYYFSYQEFVKEIKDLLANNYNYILKKVYC